MLHISDFKKYDRCPKLFWHAARNRQDYVPFIQLNENIVELSKELLMIQHVVEGQRGDDPRLALEAYHRKENLMNARFAYDELRIKVPLLLQEDGKTIVYFTYVSCYPKEHEAQGMADTLGVLSLLDIHVDEVYAIHLNASYVREGALDVRKLLIVNDSLYNAKNKAQQKIVDLIPTYTRDIPSKIEELQQCRELQHIDVQRSPVCTKGIKCSYYTICFPENIADSSILNLVQSGKKFEMLADGITDLKDVDVERIEGLRHQYAQIMAAKHDGLYIDKGAIRCWIANHIQYPISYLDFEWDTYAYPPFDGMKPLDVLVFQYSLHVEQTKGATLVPYGFIGTGDCRNAFIEDLLQHIPKEGSILVYNMEGAEKLRLIQLAQQFPQYEAALRQVWERMIDLSLPFSTGNIYDIRMAGYYSLKKIVSIYSDYRYEDFDITHGLEAVVRWRELEDADDALQQKIREELGAYCGMDTYAEYIVFHAIEELSQLDV